MEKQAPRIAFIVQCHKNPEQIHLLADSLGKIYNCHTYVHLDRKSAAIRDQICTEHLILLPEDQSVDVRWSKFSQCEATLSLIRAVLASGEIYDYIWLISGQDLPIVGADRYSRLLPEKSAAFIEVMGPENPAFRRFSKRNDIYYPEFLMERTTLSHIGRKLLQTVSGGASRTFGLFRRKLGIPYYFGSSWWCLSYDCVREMMDLLQENESWTDYFRHAINSDESFFQTLFMQTSYAGRQKGILTYIDWSQGDASPKTFTLEDMDALGRAGDRYLLGRKFDLNADSDVCHRVLTDLCGLQ